MKKMRTCKVLAKNTGLGNQIQFIPMIRELKKTYDVYSDCQTYQDLGVCNVKTDFYPSVVYEVFGHSIINHFRNRLKHPTSRFYGFCGYINFPSPKRITWGFSRYVDPGFKAATIGTRHEYWDLNQELVPTKEPFHLDGWEPVKNRIAILTSEKPGKKYIYWKEAVEELNKDFDVRVYGDSDYLPNYVRTSTFKAFFHELRFCSYFYSTDNGGMHLADILGIPGVSIFGRTSVEKNRPVNPKIKVVDFSTLPIEILGL
jgi:hypothetical protein